MKDTGERKKKDKRKREERTGRKEKKGGERKEGGEKEKGEGGRASPRNGKTRGGRLQGAGVGKENCQGKP